MNPADIVIGLLILAAVVLAVRHLRRQRGCSCGSCGCAGCSCCAQRDSCASFRGSRGLSPDQNAVSASDKK